LGLSPHEIIAAGFPLPLGIESESELIDIEVFDTFPAEIVSLDQSLAFPEGIRITSIRECDSRESIMSLTKGFVFLLTGFVDADLAIISDSLSAKPVLCKTSKNGDRKEVSFSNAILGYEISEDGLTLSLSAGQPDSIRIDSIVSQLYGSDSILSRIRIIKQSQTMADETGSLVSIE